MRVIADLQSIFVDCLQSARTITTLQTEFVVISATTIVVVVVDGGGIIVIGDIVVVVVVVDGGGGGIVVLVFLLEPVLELFRTVDRINFKSGSTIFVIASSRVFLLHSKCFSPIKVFALVILVAVIVVVVVVKHIDPPLGVGFGIHRSFFNLFLDLLLVAAAVELAAVEPAAVAVTIAIG